MEHTKKLLYQYETLIQLKNEEKLSRHQAWESELEVRSSQRADVARREGLRCARLPLCAIKVLEILKLREEEEEAHTLSISIYDTKRNEKSKEYREAMVSCPAFPRAPSLEAGLQVGRAWESSGRDDITGDVR